MPSVRSFRPQRRIPQAGLCRIRKAEALLPAWTGVRLVSVLRICLLRWPGIVLSCRVGSVDRIDSSTTRCNRQSGRTLLPPCRGICNQGLNLPQRADGHCVHPLFRVVWIFRASKAIFSGLCHRSRVLRFGRKSVTWGNARFDDADVCHSALFGIKPCHNAKKMTSEALFFQEVLDGPAQGDGSAGFL